MSIPVMRKANPLFGKPSLASANNGIARWIRGSTSPLDQKGSTGWLAELYGGVQSGDDWARLNIPADEIFVSDFNYALWSWYQTNTETMGLGIVIWVHDPNDFDNRAEITQLGGHADLPKVAGWNAFSFSSATGGMFFYGEGTTGTGLTAGTQYTWAQFQADALFKNWTIYRITLDWGWEASGTFESVYVADVKLNGVAVPLLPSIEELKTSTVTITHTQPSIAATTTAALAANTSRRYALLENDSDEVIYIKVGAAAVLNQGIRINASGGSYEMSAEIGNLNTGAINAISTSGSKVLLVVEGT